MKMTIVEKNLLSWTAMHIDFVMCKNGEQKNHEVLRVSTRFDFCSHVADSVRITILHFRQILRPILDTSLAFEAIGPSRRPLKAQKSTPEKGFSITC